MQKQAPSFGRILTMVLFALSCFGLLLFLWVSFGGSIPLKPQEYEFKIAIPEATQLAQEADVRVAGVTIGKVTKKDLDQQYPDTTIATIQIEQKYAPVYQDAVAILRQKTLLGETYVELTPGHKNAGAVPDGAMLNKCAKADQQLGSCPLDHVHVQSTVELDEIFQAFPKNI